MVAKQLEAYEAFDEFIIRAEANRIRILAYLLQLNGPTKSYVSNPSYEKLMNLLLVGAITGVDGRAVDHVRSLLISDKTVSDEFAETLLNILKTRSVCGWDKQ